MPASAGRTLTAAAIAEGCDMPLPSAISAIGRKNSTSPGASSACTRTEAKAPAAVTTVPMPIIR